MSTTLTPTGPKPTLLNCKCGFEAGKLGYSGGRNGHWSVRCTSSRCPATAQDTKPSETAERWNNMQTSL